jgi:hypothetical protein
VTVIVTAYLDAPWYLKQLRDLSRPCPAGVSATDHPTRIVCQRPYEAIGGAVYTADGGNLPDGVTPIALHTPIRAPTSPITVLDDDTIDGMARRVIALDEEQTLQLGQMRARLAAGRQLYPWHRYGLYIINDSLAERPIHFTSTTDAAALGLADYLVRQGLTFRLHDGELPDSAPAGVDAMPAAWPLRRAVGPWVDVPRTTTLFENVFVHRGGIPDWDHWADHPSSGIPLFYAWGYLGLAQAALQRGEAEDSARYRAEAERWMTLGG